MEATQENAHIRSLNYIVKGTWHASLANLAVDCVSADQSDFIEATRFNYIHSFALALLCCARVVSCTCERVASYTCEIEIERAVLHAIEDGIRVWAADVERDPLMLSEAIRHSLQVFGHDHLKPA